jgi:hypothetical protein
MALPPRTEWLRSTPSTWAPPRTASAIAARLSAGTSPRIFSVSVVSNSRPQANRDASHLRFDPRYHGANSTCMMAITGLARSNITAPHSLPPSPIPITRPRSEALMEYSTYCSIVFGLKSSPTRCAMGSSQAQTCGQAQFGNGSINSSCGFTPPAAPVSWLPVPRRSANPGRHSA